MVPLPRRFRFLLLPAGLFIIFFAFFRPHSSSAASIPDLYPVVPNPLPKPKLPSIPTLPNPFANPVHTPSEQANSSSGDIHWYSGWEWRNPFSSSVTLDENRALLPPLLDRPPIYAYYDDTAKANKTVREAENELILMWRRAWWAKGFRPVILGPSEAMKNPLYSIAQGLHLQPTLQTEVLRWLAWGYMGTGILSNWLAFPMAAYHDPFMRYLREGKYPQLERYKSLQHGLYTGAKTDINNAIQNLITQPNLNATESILNALGEEILKVGAEGDSIAYYHRTAIKDKYTTIWTKLSEHNEAEALSSLAILINSHLHTTWQNTFANGIRILRSHSEYTDILMEPAIDIARNLTQCSASPLPGSQPPNRDFIPCKPTELMSITLSSEVANASSTYYIGTVPHPYTLTSMRHPGDDLTPDFLRQDTGSVERDAWLLAITRNITQEQSNRDRLLAFKDMVADPTSAARSLWLTAERETHKDLDWIFGFSIPRVSLESLPSNMTHSTPPPAPRPPPPKLSEQEPTRESLDRERALLAKARQTIKSKDVQHVSLKHLLEELNPADTEAWRFARAFSARRRMERLKWEEEEKRFAGAEKKQGWTKWFD